jgi:hypothetical protein
MQNVCMTQLSFEVVIPVSKKPKRASAIAIFLHLFFFTRFPLHVRRLANKPLHLSSSCKSSYFVSSLILPSFCDIIPIMLFPSLYWSFSCMSFLYIHVETFVILFCFILKNYPYYLIMLFLDLPMKACIFQFLLNSSFLVLSFLCVGVFCLHFLKI